RRLHLRACTAVASIYALAVIAGGIGFYTSSSPADEGRSLPALDERVHRLTAAVAAARSQVAAAKDAQESNRKISSQPDWSRLLVVLAGQTGNDIMLRSCVLDGKTDVAAAPSPAITSPGRTTSPRHDSVSIAGV